MYLYSLLQHYKNWKPNNTHSIFSLKKKKKGGGGRLYTQHLQHHKKMGARQYTASSASQKWEPDNTHSIFSITKHGSQTLHTASSASQNMGARQYTQHLQHHKTWEPDITHSIFSITTRQDTHTHHLEHHKQHHKKWKPDS